MQDLGIYIYGERYSHSCTHYDMHYVDDGSGGDARQDVARLIPNATSIIVGLRFRSYSNLRVVKFYGLLLLTISICAYVCVSITPMNPIA